MNALFVDETRSRILSVGYGVLLILGGVNLIENVSPEDMVFIRAWIEPHHSISFQRRKLKVAGDLAANIEAGQGLVDCAGFITVLTALLFARIALAINGVAKKWMISKKMYLMATSIFFSNPKNACCY